MPMPRTRSQTGTEPTPISMEAAVGYDRIDCSHESALEHALTLKHDRLFLLASDHGDVSPPGRCSGGLFFDDTRIVSHYALSFSCGPPALLLAQVPDVYRAQIDLALTDRPFGGHSWDPKNAIHIRREMLLEARFMERVTLTNHLVFPIDFWMELSFGCDFADIFEVRGWRREGRGQFFEPAGERDRVTFRYRGRDGQMVASTFRFASPLPRLDPGLARWPVSLEPGERTVFEWHVAPDDGTDGATVMAAGLLDARSPGMEGVYGEWKDACARWRTDVATFNGALRSAVVDLRALYVESEGERVISAGIPWYSTVFGRDSILTSLQTLPLNPDIARDTLRYLARHQGEKDDPFTEEQPGKILHELRRGELARAGEIPHVPYYGSVDATPLWLILLHESWRWTGDETLIRDLFPHAERALAWLDDSGDLDGDGFLEYRRSSEKGLANQGWKDSGDGVPFPDGRLAESPIALAEVQGYAYDARVRAAALFDLVGRHAEAAELRSRAATLRARIQEHFWVDELGTFALALDGDKRPVPTSTTNAGHLLWSRVPGADQAARMVDQLLGPDMFSGWGIRTLSASHPVFNPMSYHNGSIWPHDNALVVLGLCLYGHGREALPVVSALHDAAAEMPFHRLPELFCGMPRGRGAGPVQYPVSCSPQAWASGAFFMLLQAVLGILPDAPAGVLHIREPQLPRFLRDLTVSGLRVGGSTVSLQFRRRGDRTLANLLSVEGDPLQVRIELS